MIRKILPKLVLKSFSEYKVKLALLIVLLLVNTLTDGLSLILILPVLQSIFGGSDLEITNDFLTKLLVDFDQLLANMFPQSDKGIILLGILVLIFLIKTVFSLWSHQLIISFPEDWKMIKREQVMNAYLESEYYFFSKQSHANLINTIMTDCRLGSMCIKDFLNLISNVFLAVILIFVLLITNFVITMGLVILSLIILLFSYRFVHTFPKESGKKRIVINKKIWSYVNQFINGIQKIWILGLEEKKLNQFSEVLNELKHLNSRELFKQKIPTVLAPTLIVVIFAFCVFYFKFYSANDPGSQISIIALFVIVSNRLFFTFSNISSFYIGFIKGVSNLSEIENVLWQFQKYRRNKSGLKISELNDPIVFRNVSFKFPDTDLILDDISFEIPLNKTTLIVGETGSGKSTLINLILGFLKPTSGTILVNRLDIQTYNHKFYLSKFGYVSQDVFLFDESISANLKYHSTSADTNKMNLALLKAGLSIDSDKFSQRLETSVGEKGVRLSGGEKQRISIASVFLQDPNVFIFDEPTSALDEDTESILIESLKSIQQKKTIIIVSHNLRFKNLADHVLSLNEKNIVVN